VETVLETCGKLTVRCTCCNKRGPGIVLGHYPVCVFCAEHCVCEAEGFYHNETEERNQA
jgi:hypothetical protein